jgi:hypothetical protein
MVADRPIPMSRIYYFAHLGGEVGQNCAYISNSLYLGGGPGSSRSLCLAKLAEYREASPVAGDPRYRFYSIARSYAVSPEGTITIGPERDIMGYKKDDPPRTITVEEALREIAVLDGRSGATPTPTR